MTDAQEIKQISDYLNKERKIACEVSKDANGSIIVSIEDGDWMHDHMHCERAMYDYGYAVSKEVAKADTCGDDSYSSDHYFEKKIRTNTSVKNSGKYDVGRYESSYPSYVGRYEDGGRYVSVDGHQYYSDNDVILKYRPRTEGQRMSTAAHEAGHMLAYMVAIAMETDSHEFIKECANRITMVRVKNYVDDTNSEGFIACNGEYKLSHPDAYKRMLCGGAIGEWCEELERTESQDVDVSLGYFTYAAKGHYNAEQMKSLYKSCGAETDSEHLIDLCTSTGTTIQEETLKTLRLFRHKEFIATWKVLYLKLFNQSKFTNLDVQCFAQEYRDIIYSIREDEEAKEKERKKLEYIRNNSWVKRVWHRICRYVIRDNMNKKDTDV